VVATCASAVESVDIGDNAALALGEAKTWRKRPEGFVVEDQDDGGRHARGAWPFHRAEAGHLDKAIELARSTDFDLAILDVNLDGKMITPVATLIKTRNLPIIFATGYGAWGVPEEFQGACTAEAVSA
jgi:CheY-like chemotaxis protein